MFTVSCSKDEGGTKNPVNPAKPITITAENITAAFKGLAKITIGKMDFDFASFDGQQNSLTKNGTLNGQSKETTLEKATIEGKFTSGLKVSGATVEAKVTSVPEITTATEITITITITPASGNSFAKPLTPYTEADGTVKVTLTLKPEAKSGGGNKKWNGTE